MYTIDKLLLQLVRTICFKSMSYGLFIQHKNIVIL